MMLTVNAPWTNEQVKVLNQSQQRTDLHPFTCPNRGDGKHGWLWGDHGTLIATPDGWICPACGYTQNWAYEIQLEEEPSKD